MARIQDNLTAKNCKMQYSRRYEIPLEHHPALSLINPLLPNWNPNHQSDTPIHLFDTISVSGFHPRSMATARKMPLQSSSLHNCAINGTAAAKKKEEKKTVEEMYQKKTTQLEHILLRPDTYIGSTEKHTQMLWVYEDGELVHRAVTYVPGLYKIFDEILVNAANNKQRDLKMDSVKVEIDQEGNCISVYNNGDGIPVEIHSEEGGVYMPELIFGHLITSSNYDDDVKKMTGGRNGYGAKLTNIFSTEFVIQTADGKRQKMYKQVFSENMGKKSEPSITKCKEGENWTKITFKPDLVKFKMDHLEDDVVALMKKRVLDLAGTLGKSVKVELNGVRVPIRSFSDYVDMYLQSASKSRPEPLPKIVEKVNDRWEVCVSLSEGQFQQVSFVNGINTIKGGTHVEHVTQQIANHVMAEVNKKNKNANLKAHVVRNHLWVFVNTLVENPAFDSQTKKTLTTQSSSFGSKCELSKAFLTKVAKSGVVSSLLSWADFKQSKELKKTDGTKRQRITGIPKLEDANDAGGKNSEKCTLILTEGDSTKALAMAGISVVGRNFYGVFPIGGKLLNVRDANHKQIMENAEIQNIKQILGLQHGKEYDSTKGLRYGHLMIMTDQDHDGSHIKGLLINFIHSFWPSLLKIPTFMVEFITPIVKATHNRNKTVLSFYSMPEYETWKESLAGDANSWTIKYYKGLGTSTSKEGKEYFQAIENHKKYFVWSDENDGDAIELAFSKKKVEDRKNWLRQFEPGTYLDQREKCIKYSDFVNKELIRFSMADLQRSIPSMVDGLKPSQRKILFCSFKRNFVKEAKVAQFSGYVSEHSAYHNGEQSLASTIIGMAQDFVGSNNINLLQPNGQFGTRHQGGKDHASARYIYTRLSPLTRFLFPKDDDVLLEYQTEDGQSIEPVWYMPVIPMVLVNGSEGIGTEWSTFVPNYNPRDIVANVKRLLNDEPMEPMDPWYKGFKGVIEKSATKEAGDTYTITGVIEQVNSTTLRITELPIRKWTQDYKEFLESLMTGNDKIKEPFIKDYREHNDDVAVHFEVILSEENMNIAIQEGLEKKFKLTTTIATTNMHLFDSKGVIKKYDGPEQILEDFFHKRLDFYAKRKRALLDNLELDLLKLDNKVRFILGVVEGDIIVCNRKRAELLFELKRKGFIPFTKKTKAMVSGSSGTEEDNEDTSPEAVAGGVIRASDYEYLLSMPIGTLTLEKVQQLCAERDKLEAEVDELRKASPKALWMKDLNELDKELDEQEKKDVEAETARKAMQEKALAAGGAAVLKSMRKPKKNNAVLQEVDTDDADYLPESTKCKAKGTAPKRASAKKSEVVIHDNEVDEVLELKEHLASDNNENVSPDYTVTEMEAECSAGLAAQISENEAPPQPQEKKKRGRKPAAVTKPKAAAAFRKRGPMLQSRLQTEDPVNGKEDDDAVLCLAAYNHEKSSAHYTVAEMESESSAGQTTQISENEAPPQPQEKKKRGRKPAAVIKPKAAAAFRKRGPMLQSRLQSEDSVNGNEDDDDDDAVLELKERLAACNHENSSPDHTVAEMESESSAGRAMQISENEAPPQPQDKKKRGRKPAAETKPKAVVAEIKPKTAAANRKRGPTSQKVSSDEKAKVRKTRASPVKRKRRGGDNGSSSDIDELETVAVVAPRERPKRGNARKAVYVESDSDEENDPIESDFD